MIKGQSSLLYFLLLISIWWIPFPCTSQSADVEWTINPSDYGDGYYTPGQQMDLSVIITNLSLGSGWVHGFTFDFPDGYDLSTLEMSESPNGCGNDGWGWYTSVNGSGGLFGPGYFYESNGDANPGNNWGEYCGEASYTISFQVDLISSCNPGTYLDESSLLPSITVTSDGASGSWTGLPITFPLPYYGSPLLFSCCSNGFAGQMASQVIAQTPSKYVATNRSV